MGSAPAKPTHARPESAQSLAVQPPAPCWRPRDDDARDAAASAVDESQRPRSLSTRGRGECPTDSDAGWSAHPISPPHPPVGADLLYSGPASRSRSARAAIRPAPARSTVPITLPCATRRADPQPAVVSRQIGPTLPEYQRQTSSPAGRDPSPYPGGDGTEFLPAGVPGDRCPGRLPPHPGPPQRSPQSPRQSVARAAASVG